MTNDPKNPPPLALSPAAAAQKPKTQGTDVAAPPPLAPANGEIVQENGGPKGPEPTRFGDWERKGRCSDF